MEQIELREKQRKVLNGLKEIFDLTGYITEWSDEESNRMTDMVIAEHPEIGKRGDEVLGEYFFLPGLETSVEVLHLVVSLTITDSLRAKRVGTVRKAVSRINSVLPMGAFVMNRTDEILSYRFVVSFFPEEETDMMIRKASYHVAMGLQFTALWMDALLDLDGGKLTYEDFEQDFEAY